MQHWLVLLLGSARDTSNVKYRNHFGESPCDTVGGAQFTNTESVIMFSIWAHAEPWVPRVASQEEGDVRSEHNPEAVLFDTSVAICSIGSVQLVAALSKPVST